ncbi:MAG: hypothetical protein C4291_07450 [Candidatus Dadabacteria bacterium]
MDGKLVDSWVPDLGKLCLHYRDEKNKTVVLDFSGVTFIDDRGVRMLENIKDEKIISCDTSQNNPKIVADRIRGNNK